MTALCCLPFVGLGDAFESYGKERRPGWLGCAGSANDATMNTPRVNGTRRQILVTS